MPLRDYGFPGALVRERGGPLPSPPREDGPPCRFSSRSCCSSDQPAGGAHAAGAVSPQERLTSTIISMKSRRNHQQDRPPPGWRGNSSTLITRERR